MADLTALQSIAELLPEERRGRFFEIANKFANVRDDDDHLQMLEAVGFMMMVMENIPEKVAGILERARTALGAEDAERLRTEIAEILTQSLDTPSYKDLRETVRAIRDQGNRFKREVNELHSSLADSKKALSRANRFLPNMVTGLVGGAVVACLAGVLSFWLEVGQADRHGAERAAPKELAPYVTLLERGQLDYFEFDNPDFGGRVGMFLLGGDILTAFKDGDHGVVVSKPINPGPNRAPTD